MTGNLAEPTTRENHDTSLRESIETANDSSCPIRKAIQHLKKGASHVTLEPMLFLKMMAEGNIIVVGTTLKIERVCRVNLNFSDEECSAMDDGNHSQIQTAVQVYENTFSYYQNLIDSILPILVILLAGSASDRYGRKLPMASVLAGFVALALVNIAIALHPSWPVEAFYAATVAVDITGSWCVFNMAVYSYLADITSTEKRTKRMGWMDAVWYLGGPVGTLLGGWLYESYGYVTVFVVSAILWSVCLAYVIVVVKESVRTEVPAPDGKPYQFVFDLGRAASKHYPHRGRLHLLLLMAVKLNVFLVQGHQVYLWARRVLGWDATQFSIWSGAEKAIHQLEMVVWVGLASYYHLSGHTVAIFGLISIAFWSIALACITYTSLWWLTIVATLLGSLEAGIDPALRALITSIPDKRDVGKILAFLGLLESIWLIVDRSVYTHLYNAFVQSFPQINFLFESTVAAILILVLVILKRDWTRQRSLDPARSSSDK